MEVKVATWIAHLRVAENVLEQLKLNRGLFLIGNLAPDCNQPNEDWSLFTPDAKITHFRFDGKTRTEPDRFLNEYYKQSDEILRKSFMLGYYSHLLTDNLWSEMINNWKDENPEIKERISRDKSYIWTVKKDWYGQDFKYLEEHTSNIFTDEFLKLGKVSDYLDFFPADIMNEKLEYIKAFYTNEEKKIQLNDFKYLSTKQMDEFVLNCSDLVISKLIQLI